MKICILIGSADISGGTVVIFEHALYLSKQGHDVFLLPYFPLSVATPNWHRGLEKLRFITWEKAAETVFDIAIATWWRTVYELPRVKARRYAYFVQSIESRFYPEREGALRRLVDMTYTFGLPIITETGWIKDWLSELGNEHISVVLNGCDKRVFTPDGPHFAPRQPGRLRVLVEGALGVDFKNVARTLALLRKSSVNEIWLMTPSPISWYPGVRRVFSQVPLEKTAEIYRSCDVLVKLSTVEGMFGPPLEMFHCGGTAIVWNVTGHEEYVEDGRNAIVLPVGDEKGVIAAINRLRNEPDVLWRLKQGALATASSWPDWSETSPLFATALQNIMKLHPIPTRQQLKEKTTIAMEEYAQKENINKHIFYLLYKKILKWSSQLCQSNRFLKEAVILGRALMLEERRLCIRPLERPFI